MGDSTRNTLLFIAPEQVLEVSPKAPTCCHACRSGIQIATVCFAAIPAALTSILKIVILVKTKMQINNKKIEAKLLSTTMATIQNEDGNSPGRGIRARGFSGAQGGGRGDITSAITTYCSSRRSNTGLIQNPSSRWGASPDPFVRHLNWIDDEQTCLAHIS